MISVIVPVYNVENVLKYCIDSILKQKYNDFELLLIDDGSTDKSGSICDEYAGKDKRVRVIHKQNGGVSSARNAGIDNSLGEYICFIDSDDYLTDEYLQELITLKENNSSAKNIWCGFCTTEEYGNYDFSRQTVFEADKPISITNRKKIMDIHKKWLDAGPVCKLYDKSIINDNNIRFNKDLSLGEDLIFNFDYLDCAEGDILIINKPLYLYVINTVGSLSKKFHENLFEKYKYIHSVMYNYMIKWNCDGEQIRSFYETCFYIYDNVLRNTFKPDSTIKHKYCCNRKIIKSDEFKESMTKGKFYINPVMKFILEHNLSFLYKVLFIR